MTAQKLWGRDQRVIDANAAMTVNTIDFSVESHLRVDSNDNFPSTRLYFQTESSRMKPFAFEADQIALQN